MTSRVLGLVREVVFAYFFGASNAADAYLIAFRIPNLLRDLFAEGTMSSAFVPIFTRQLTLHGKRRAWSFGSSVLTALTLVTGAMVVAGIAYAEPLVRLYAEDYEQVPGKLELTIQLTRIMLPFLALIGIAATLMGMLNALRHFFVPALSPVMFNVGSIVCMVALVPVMPALGLPEITAVAIGVLVGGAGQVLLQWPSLHREGFRYRPMLHLRDPALHRMAWLLGPSIVGLAAVQVNLFVNSVLATGEGTGAVAWLNYAFRLMYLPIGVFGVSVATAALPEISQHAALEDTASFRAAVARGLRLMLSLNVPATFGLIVLAQPIVALIFERGSFQASDSTATAQALAFYAPGLIGYSIVKLASPAFYALNDSRTPAVISILTMLLNVVLNLLLVQVMGYRGLALGTGIAALFNAGMLLWKLRGRLGGLHGGSVAKTLGKIVVAALLMAVAAWLVERTALRVLPGTGTFIRAVRVLAAVGSGLLVLAGSAHLLRVAEFEEARRIVTSRLRRP